MKNLTKLTFICTVVLFATLFSEPDPNRQKYLSAGGSGSYNTGSSTGTYYVIAFDLLNYNFPKKIGNNQVKALAAFNKGTMKISQLRHFEKALQKHPCFYSTKNSKGRKLTTIPDKNARPDWFVIDCDKSKN
tara:strand:+ start:139 stop:534 length:396 start_codon:yes stop_codon:yes gene_type:complete